MKNVRNFENWFKNFTDSINGYGYYVDFKTVYDNANKLKVELNILNSLINESNIEGKFKEILQEYPKCLKAVPILLAVRQYEIYCQDVQGKIWYRFDDKKQSSEQYCYFMRKTGLFDLLQRHLIANLFDYVTGVEVGLNANARKNRGGDQMENLVESYLQKANVRYSKETYLEDLEKKFGLDLSTISANKTSTKRWDFVVETSKCVYAIETNFYTAGGSKLNETARSYKTIAEEASSIKGFEFMWITDGNGWQSAYKNLHETFDVMDHLYNIHDLEQGVFSTIFA